jgi:nucleoside-diphosphate-sugar epimerase
VLESTSARPDRREHVKVAVTGATGFVGTSLVARLLADGHEVHALVHPSADDRQLRDRGVRIVVGDVREFASVERTFAGVEVVYHLAAVVPGAARTRAEYAAVNVGGAANVARAAVSARVRHLVHCSTVAVHGPRAGTKPRARARAGETLVTEETPVAPVNAYQRTKLTAERIVTHAAREHGLSVAIARLTSLYGPGDRRSVRLYGDIARGRLLVIGDGTPRCHPTYLDDAIAGLCCCGNRKRSPGEIFIIGGRERPSVNELVETIAAALGVTPRVVRIPRLPFGIARALYRGGLGRICPPPGLIDRFDFFLDDQAYDVSKADRELGFHARVSLRDGIERAVAWYREAQLL